MRPPGSFFAPLAGLPGAAGAVRVHRPDPHTVVLDARGPVIPLDGEPKQLGCSEAFGVFALATYVVPGAVVLDALHRLCAKVGLRPDDLPVVDIVDAVLQSRDAVFPARPTR